MNRTLSRLILPLALGLATFACGAGGDGNAFGASCVGGDKLCVISCSLGCSKNACALNRIAENQEIVFEFSQVIDPASVTISSFSIRDVNGVPADGDYLVEGTRVSFQPAINLSGPKPTFGFKEGASYSIVLTGSEPGSIRSAAGAALTQTLSCTIVASEGIVDIDNKRPVATLITPDKLTDVSPTTIIVLEFSEPLNTAVFRGGGAGQGIEYNIIPSDKNGKCTGLQVELPGTVSVSLGERKNRIQTTLVVFRPAVKLPGQACILVKVRDRIVDLSGKGAIPVDFTFQIRKGGTELGVVEENFTTTAKLDKEFTGAVWADGKLRPGKVGASGMHGEFQVDIVPQQGFVKGRKLYIWNTDLVNIPFTQTLRGVAFWKKKLGQNRNFIDVRNGVFEFLNFKLPRNAHLRFIGKNIPSIRVSGQVLIEGVIEMQASAVTLAKPNKQGGPGGAGATGAARGGQGGDAPTNPKTTGGGFIQGRSGGNVVFPSGHPRAGDAQGTGGGGSPANPSSGRNVDVKLAPGAGFTLARMTAAGGSGGSLWSPGANANLGTAGFAEFALSKPPPNMGNYQPEDKGKPGVPGRAFSVLPVVKGFASTKLFLIGGSGGAGGGSHVAASFETKANTVWRAGRGGAGGGGVLHFQSGGDFVLRSTGSILLPGGNGALSLPTEFEFLSSAGGGGSGGSVLVQTGSLASVSGEVNVLGGRAGKTQELQIVAMRSVGGTGGAGYIRIESDPAPSHTAFPGFRPVSTSQNVGKLRPEDYDNVTNGMSGWYNTGSLLRPTYLFYRIFAKINGNDFTFSDEKNNSTWADTTQPIALLVQSVKVDLKTGDPIPTVKKSAWSEGTLEGINNDEFGHNGFRFLIRFDKSKLFQSKKVTELEIDKIQIFFRA